MNVPFGGIQFCQLRQRRYLWWNCARQGIAGEVTARQKLESVRESERKKLEKLTSTEQKGSEGSQVFQIDQRRYLGWYRPSKIATDDVAKIPNIVT